MGRLIYSMSVSLDGCRDTDPLARLGALGPDLAAAAVPGSEPVSAPEHRDRRGDQAVTEPVGPRGYHSDAALDTAHTRVWITLCRIAAGKSETRPDVPAGRHHVPAGFLIQYSNVMEYWRFDVRPTHPTD